MREMRVWLSLVVVAACGGGGAKPDAPPPDAGPRCDPGRPFDPPVLIDSLDSDRDDACARLSPDELVVTFSRRNSAGTYDLFTAVRADLTSAFGAPALLASANSVANDVWPTVSPDGLTLMFEADRTTPNVFHILISHRVSVTDAWGPPATKAELMDGDEDPLLANGQALYFSTTLRGGQGAADIFRSDVDATGMVATPVALLGGINTADHEDSPAVTADERRIFFRHVTLGAGGESDVYTASRSTPQDGFGPATAVDGLNLPGITEVPTWISPDGCHLYGHISGHAGGPGGADLYVASRPL